MSLHHSKPSKQIRFARRVRLRSLIKGPDQSKPHNDHRQRTYDPSNRNAHICRKRATGSASGSCCTGFGADRADESLQALRQAGGDPWPCPGASAPSLGEPERSFRSKDQATKFGGGFLLIPIEARVLAVGLGFWAHLLRLWNQRGRSFSPDMQAMKLETGETETVCYSTSTQGLVCASCWCEMTKAHGLRVLA